MCFLQLPLVLDRPTTYQTNKFGRPITVQYIRIFSTLAENMLLRRFVSPTAVVNGNGILWTAVVLSAFVVGTSSLSPLYDERR